jgi:hypothetical protein
LVVDNIKENIEIRNICKNISANAK